MSQTDDNDYKELLRGAETHIVSLQQENEALKADLNNMIEAQAHETEQMVQMSEQLWKLEEALLSATEEKDVAMMLLKSLQDNVERIKSYAETTLGAVKENKASRLSMAAHVYEIKSMVDTLKLEKKNN
jgi:signal recognition particle GTPase